MFLVETSKMSDEKTSAWNINAAQKVRGSLAKNVFLVKTSLGVLEKQIVLTLNNPCYN